MDKFGFQLVERVDPHREYWVILETTKEDFVEIQGTSGVAMSNGLYMYDALMAC